MSEPDRQLMRTSLFIGLEMDPFNAAPKRGDFLVRNLVGIDYKTGVLAIGAPLHEGQVVQFHLRDRATSAEDLEHLLGAYAAGPNRTAVGGALLFSCVGRGQYLYGTPSHDSRKFLGTVAQVPLGGCFCNGEIGPVGMATYIHGYTSSFGIFRPSKPADE
jgi:small ligand-binding sensory domain FIST